MDRKYKITYSGKITGKTPNYILSLRAHLKGIFPEMERYGKEEFDHVLHCISSFIDDFYLQGTQFPIPGRHPEKDYQ